MLFLFVFIFIGFAINFMFAFLLHAFSHNFYKCIISFFKWTTLRKIFLYILSPDYTFAKKYKLKNPFEKTELIKLWNIFNFTLPIFLIILIFITFYSFDNSIIFEYNNLLVFIFWFWLFRVISRSIEIIIAFFNDVITSKVTSKLDTKDRIKLAIKSYFEVIFMYGILYFLIYFLSTSASFKSYIKLTIPTFLYKYCSFILKDLSIDSIGGNSIFSFVARSFFISTCTNVNGFNILFIFQIITSLSLVIFAIAGYLNGVKEYNTNQNSIFVVNDKFVIKK